MFVLGWFFEGGHRIEYADDSLQRDTIVQGVLGTTYNFLFLALFFKIFVTEATIDFWRHQRVVVFFLHAVGAMGDIDVRIWGFKLPGIKETEASKMIIETSQDLNAIFVCYDFLVKYLRLRATFHNGFFAFLIIVDISAALAFLLSTMYEGLAVGALAQMMLFTFAAVSSAAMVMIAVPLTRTS